MLKAPVWIPIRSLGDVNIYILDLGDGGVGLIDAGMLTGRSVLSLASHLRNAGSSLCRVERVALTHFHVDHSTMALLLSRLGSVEITIGSGDYQVVKTGVEEFIRGAISLFIDNGMPREEADAILSNHPAYRYRDVYDEIAELDLKPVREGDTIDMGEAVLRVAELPGHTPGHVAYVWEEEKAAFVGDVILERITPHVTIHNWGSNPLRDYLNSLERLAGMGLRIAYPGHRGDIVDPAGRAREIIEHHKERLQDILNILSREGALSGYEIAKRVKWRVKYRSWDEYPYAERFFAMGEALAHLKYLEDEGRVEKTFRGGVTLWKPA